MKTPDYIQTVPKILNGEKLSFVGWCPEITYPNGSKHPEHVLFLAEGSRPGCDMMLSVEGWNNLPNA